MHNITNSNVIKKTIVFLIILFVLFLFFFNWNLTFTLLFLIFFISLLLSFMNTTLIDIQYREDFIVITKQKLFNKIINAQKETTHIPIYLLHHYEIQYGLLPTIQLIYLDQKDNQIVKKVYPLIFFNRKQLIEFDLLLYKTILN